MPDTHKNEHVQDRLTVYQAIACQVVRGWSVYITFYAVTIMLVVVTFRSNSENASSLLLELARDPAIWGIVLMPPLFMMFLKWSTLALVTRLHNLGIDQTSIQQSLFSQADSLAEPAIVDEAFDLHFLLQHMVDSRDAIAQDKGIRISIEIRSDVPENVAGQPTVLTSVLNELLDGALKRTEQGEIYISVKVLEQAHGKLLLRFEVGDSGPGDDISNDHLHHCQELLATAGGQISEHNKKGHGHTVWFTIMLRKDHKQTAVA